jgi:hypothetical protein
MSISTVEKKISSSGTEKFQLFSELFESFGLQLQDKFVQQTDMDNEWFCNPTAFSDAGFDKINLFFVKNEEKFSVIVSFFHVDCGVPGHSGGWDGGSCFVSSPSFSISEIELIRMFDFPNEFNPDFLFIKLAEFILLTSERSFMYNFCEMHYPAIQSRCSKSSLSQLQKIDDRLLKNGKGFMSESEDRQEELVM